MAWETMAAAGINAAMSTLQAGVNAIQNAQNRKWTEKENTLNRDLIRETNAANIQAAKEQQELARQYALEDRDYNSEGNQYSRLIALGMSPAMARAAVKGGDSNLLGAIQSMPQQQAPQDTLTPNVNPYSFDGAGIGSALISGAEMRQNKEMHDEQVELEQRRIALEELRQKEELVFETYGREETNKGRAAMAEVWQDIKKYCRENDININDYDRADFEDLLSHTDKGSSLLAKIDSLSPVSSDLLDVEFNKTRTAKEQSVNIDSAVAGTQLTKAQTLVQKATVKQIKEQLKYYPALMNLELQYKDIVNNMTAEQLHSITMSNAYEDATVQQRLEMLGIEVDANEIQRDILKWEKEHKGFTLGMNIVSQVLGAVATGIGIYTGVKGVKNLGKISTNTGNLSSHNLDPSNYSHKYSSDYTM